MRLLEGKGEQQVQKKKYSLLIRVFYGADRKEYAAKLSLSNKLQRDGCFKREVSNHKRYLGGSVCGDGTFYSYLMVKVADLRQCFYHSIAPEGLAGDRRAVVPASEFAFSAQQIWKTIKENKDLDLPAHKVMVATVRCEEIAKEKFNSFVVNKEWLDLEETVKSTIVTGFSQNK